MNSLVKNKLPELNELCRKHHVRRLTLFGSAADGGFEAGSSDLDFLVEFELLPPAQHARNFFSLLRDLEELFHRSIDLLEPEPITNPYLLRAIEESKVSLYDAA